MSEQMTIMITEDDEILAEEMKVFLEKWGYQVSAVLNYNDIVSEFSRLRPQLILMDINLPCYDGFYWCQKIREFSEVPIIYISSRSDDRDKIMAIAQGGDDYVEKPFHLELLKAKIDAILRRTYRYKVKNRTALNEDLYFDFPASALIYHGHELDLTRSEKKIIACLMDAKSEVVTREELMNVLWNTDEFVSDSTLTTLICRLRSKLKSSCAEEIIQTKKGLGYYIM
ncbi:MAG: response regulator transcription factor [Lachnospiraceae bacterium]|nr:response regulator transcription factor [Lachnospiraceae bacterium]